MTCQRYYLVATVNKISEITTQSWIFRQASLYQATAPVMQWKELYLHLVVIYIHQVLHLCVTSRFRLPCQFFAIHFRALNVFVWPQTKGLSSFIFHVHDFSSFSGET